MSRWLRVLLMNAAALAGCFLILLLVPGAMRPSVEIVAAVLALCLVNVIAFLVPQLYRGAGGKSESTNVMLTLILLVLAGVLAWLWHRR